MIRVNYSERGTKYFSLLIFTSNNKQIGFRPEMNEKYSPKPKIT